MDQLDDDFQLKPMTAGLGFHKKPVSLKDHTTAAQLVADRISKSLPVEPPPILGQEVKTRSKEEILSEIKQALQPRRDFQQEAYQARNEAKKLLTETLPRETDFVANIHQLSPEVQIPLPTDISPMDIVNFEIPNATLKESIQPSAATRRGAYDAKIRELVPVSFSLPSTILDAVIVLAVSLVFLMTLTIATAVSLNAVIASASSDRAALFSLVVLYLAVWQMYVVVARSFFGATLGEWTFDLQLGETAQHSDTYYPAKVLIRTLLVMVTGFVLLPVLSLISGRDIAARICGLQLYRRNI